MTMTDTSADQTTTILLVVEDAAMQAFLADNFMIDGYRVLVADDPQTATELAAEQHPDAALVDVNAGSGLRFAEAVRGERAAGVNRELAMILMGSQGSQGGELEALRSLHAGADDYVSKPFSYPVLRARIDALMRRCDLARRSQRVRVGAVTIDLVKRTVHVAGERVQVTRRELQLLAHLARDPTRVFTKDELLAHIWGYRSFGATRTLDSHACRLRHKLAGAGQAMVINVWGVGYRLVDGELPSESDQTLAEAS